MKENEFGTFMLDGELVNIDKLSIQELEDINKKFEEEEIKTRIKINTMLGNMIK